MARPDADADPDADTDAHAHPHADARADPARRGLAPVERLAQQVAELVPFDQERVVALGRADLAVPRVDAGRRRRRPRAP